MRLTKLTKREEAAFRKLQSVDDARLYCDNTEFSWYNAWGQIGWGNNIPDAVLGKEKEEKEAQ